MQLHTLAMDPCVCVSVASLDLGLPCRLLTEIRISPKIRVLPFGTLSETLVAENLAAARSSCQSVIDNTWRRRWVRPSAVNSLPTTINIQQCFYTTFVDRFCTLVND